MVQERRALLRTRIREYFTSLGYREVACPDRIDAAFERDGVVVGVKMIELTSNPARDKRFVRRCMLSLLRERPCDLIYLAVEEVLPSHLPEPVEFRESGIGLLRVSWGGVEVAFPATPLRSSAGEKVGGESPRAVPSSQPAALPIEEIVRRELERILKAQLSEVLERVVKAAVTPPPMDGSSEVKFVAKLGDASAGAQGVTTEALVDVDFLRGNPWLAEIARRSGEG